MTVWVVLTTLIVAVASPADLAGAARMSEIPRGFGAIDAWYLAPLALTDRLGAGALWAVVLGVGVLSFSVPWLFARGRARVARVEPALCNACEKCYHDCPYDAIQMVPRPAGGKPIATMALVDPAKCLGCGICAGSCDSAGVGLDWFSVVDQRKRIDRLIERALERNERPLLALVCNESAGNGLVIDEATGVSPELPGYVVVRVPCAGWVHPLTVERALRRNAEGVLIVASGPSACMYREGSQWTVQRMTGQRAPALNTNKVDPDRVRVLELFRTEKRRLVLEAAAFRERAAPRQARRSRTTRLVSGLGVAALVGLVTWGGTRVGWASQTDPSPKLVVSFKHPGVAAENCREPSPEELAKLPKHMQARKICERRRANVRLRVHIDGREVVARAYEPRGIWHDGNSIGIERIPTKPGPHEVRVELGDSADAAAYDFSATRTVTMRERHNTVVLFDKMSGFTWYE
jgi:coenzyme F420-reducing hydrogenase delta subunit/NAD-dependent dihydropyrimidine dehydrogenase PreA subunit